MHITGTVKRTELVELIPDETNDGGVVEPAFSSSPGFGLEHADKTEPKFQTRIGPLGRCNGQVSRMDRNNLQFRHRLSAVVVLALSAAGMIFGGQSELPGKIAGPGGALVGADCVTVTLSPKSVASIPRNRKAADSSGSNPDATSAPT